MPAKRQSRPPPQLHELEAEVMEEVWRRDRATVREVFEALNEVSKPRAYTTIMTIMMRLDRKGLLRRKRQGKTDVYWPVMSKAAYLDARAATQVDAVIEEFGDLAFAHFAKHVERLGERELDELRGLARGE